MQPTEADNPPGNNGNKRRPARPTPPRLQILIPHPIPQITYSEPPYDPNQEPSGNQLALTPKSLINNGDNSLSPPRSPNRASSSPTSPLPLTRDILLKKDKLDRTLDRVEYRHSKPEEKQPSRLDIREWRKLATHQQHSRTSSANSAFEPLSAGGSLTIPSPQDIVHLKTPTSPQLTNFMYENAYRYASGMHDSSVRNSSHSGSSVNANPWSSFMSTMSAHSGSSIAEDNLSAEAFDPTTHYYTQREEYDRQLSAERRFRSRPDLQPPPHTRLRNQQSNHSSHYVWNMLCNIASRVVTSRSCETHASLLFLAQNKSFAASTDWLLLTGDDAYFAAQHSTKEKADKLANINEKSSILTSERRLSTSRHSTSSQDNNSAVSNRLRSSASLQSIPKSSSVQEYPNYNVFKSPEAGPESQSKLSEKEEPIEIEDIIKFPKPTPLEGSSLRIFSSQSRFRLSLWRLVRSRYVQRIYGMYHKAAVLTK